MGIPQVIPLLALGLVLAGPAEAADDACCSRCAPFADELAGQTGRVPAAAAGDSDGRSERILSRILRSPGRLLEVDRRALLASVARRIDRRIAEARRSVWSAPGGSIWYTSYEAGYRIARAEQKMLVVYFASDGDDAIRDEFEANTLADAAVTEWLGQVVGVRVPVAQPHFDGTGTLITDPAFAHLGGKPGLALIDLAGDRPELDGMVTFVRPFGKRSCSALELATILGLPRATPTQRTMIYAVRMHPEQPLSTQGELNQYLLDQAASHSQHMANIRVQGHHNWDTRFYQISRGVSSGGGSFTAKEVVAESWGWEENLLDAAIECVHSWRQSPGHWSAVRASHHFYGYDMKQGSNGKWYATGLFGDGDSVR